MENIFAPHELKTIEVDVENRIFKVNGENFGHGCTEFTITCDGFESFNITMEIGTKVRFAKFQGAKCVSDVSCIPHRPETKQDHLNE